MVATGRRDARLGTVVETAARAGLSVEREAATAIARLAGDAAPHQGVLALVEDHDYASPESILDRAPLPQLLVVLDGVEDPRNLGAVIRSAAGAGAGGLFVPERRSSGLTGACFKAAAGAAERLPIAQVGNVVNLLKTLKKRGIWVAGLDARSGTPWSSFDFSLPLALVLGGEGRGLRRLVRETCDVLLSIPLQAGVESLNLSVAAGIVLYEAVRQRSARGG